MSSATSATLQAKEAKPAREGKSYGYQKPAEAAAAPVVVAVSAVETQKQKVVSAFDDFLDALADQVSPGGTGGTTPSNGSTPNAPGTGPGTTYPATGTGGTGTGGAGSGSGTGTTTGAGTGTTGTGAPSGGTGTTGTTAPSTGGEAANSEAAKKEAFERYVAVQKEAYVLDRLRESTKLRRKQSESAPSPTATLIGAVNMHQSDSNRAPLTESKEFKSYFGAQGRSQAPTIEKMAAPRSERPETVPAPGVVNLKPIDAYWGSYGNAIERAAARAQLVSTKLYEVILGSDDRVRVTNNQLYPWRCICSLLITANTGAQYVGTGWLVGPRLLLTAGHCVYMSDEGGWVSQIEVAPGRDADNRPFGTVVATDMRSVTGWTRDGNSDFDYGAIILPADKRLGDQLGWFGYANRPDDYLRNVTLNLSGYPGDGGPAHVDGTQWFHSRTVKDVFEKQLTYEIDTYGGQSGSPVWEMTSEGYRYGVAIHTFGTSVNNGGTRITGEVHQNILNWSGEAA
ncbi:serine protease [Mesorhizobium sp. M0902]|uniref:trypsin-like serine peptidase n=1 Tax=unclassified Mesorhizobium TaxID=325217 RepID=UPI0033355C52